MTPAKRKRTEHFEAVRRRSLYLKLARLHWQIMSMPQAFVHTRCEDGTVTVKEYCYGMLVWRGSKTGILDGIDLIPLVLESAHGPRNDHSS